MLARIAIGILFGIFHLAIFPAIVNGQGRTDVTKQRPNIVFMMSDDQAWNGLSVPMHPYLTWSKSAIVDTPNLEKLATQGMRFSAAYAPASVCAPTR
ncbi:MAG: sulfatase-like hydrolase/transferase, partial [Planctomycetaceae bacterium]|nr:sulfatase-like hydrolase/transferase [Planctomycetaceae bacterium]